MNKAYSTDLQVAEDLANLVKIINESIESAERTLEKAKEIDEVKELIVEIRSSREALLKVQETIKQIEAKANIQLAQAQRIQEKLQELKTIPDTLVQLGIDESALQAIQVVLNNANAVKQDIQNSKKEALDLFKNSKKSYVKFKEFVEKSEQIKQEIKEKFQELIEWSDKITQDNQELYNAIVLSNNHIEKTMIKSSQNVDYVQKILQEINSIGGLEQIKKLIQEMQDSRSNLKQSEQQLLMTQQNLLKVKALEDYLCNFQNIRNRKQLWQWLQQELGFIGVIVYLLSLIAPRRKK